MVDLPGILEDVDRLEGCLDEAVRVRLARDVLLRCRVQARIYRMWLLSVRVQRPDAYDESLAIQEADDENDGNEDIEFRSFFTFQDMLIAQAMMHYWAAMLIVISCLVQCQKVVEAPLDASNDSNLFVNELVEEGIRTSHGASDGAKPVSVDELSELAEHMADCICKAIPYNVSDELSTTMLKSVCAPLWVARDYYSNQSGERCKGKLAWCVRQLEKISPRELGSAQVP